MVSNKYPNKYVNVDVQFLSNGKHACPEKEGMLYTYFIYGEFNIGDIIIAETCYGPALARIVSCDKMSCPYVIHGGKRILQILHGGWCDDMARQYRINVLDEAKDKRIKCIKKEIHNYLNKKFTDEVKLAEAMDVPELTQLLSELHYLENSKENK